MEQRYSAGCADVHNRDATIPSQAGSQRGLSRHSKCRAYRRFAPRRTRASESAEISAGLSWLTYAVAIAWVLSIEQGALMLDSFKTVDDLDVRKRLHCVLCKRVTIHRAESRCRSTWSVDGGQINGGEDYTILRCGACDSVCYETLSWDSETLDYDEDGNLVIVEISKQYPAPVSAHFSFNTESTPPRLNMILEEMLYSLAGSKTILATMGLRLAVEFIVRDRQCAGRNLAQKIDDLRVKGLIDEDQKDLLHRIRNRGNAGAHEARGMSAKELVVGMSIIEGLLEKLYNGPARHEATITRAKQLLRDE